MEYVIVADAYIRSAGRELPVLIKNCGGRRANAERALEEMLARPSRLDRLLIGPARRLRIEEGEVP